MIKPTAYVAVHLLFALLCICGAYGIDLSNIRTASNSRIIGGSPIQITEAKYQVGIFKIHGGRIILCGGVLVKPGVVLTSANCLINNVTTDWYVMAGAHDLWDGVFAQSSTVKKIVFHSSFVSPVDNNIALIQLNQTFTLNDRVGVVQISNSTPSDPSCTTAGWGRTSDGIGSIEQLLSVNVNLINKTYCAESLASEGNFNLDRVICTKNEESYHGPCLGDYGGALMCSGQFVGLSSLGFCDGRNLPSLYTEVRHFHEWVEKESVGAPSGASYIAEKAY